ncbi:MAG: GNAT family N-acetyltransferase [Acidobacteria bacterium]|nr:MAG: GNAT family N-acetyltransferase [Acidobacteriota bacterium]REK02674.1 MAG: GNAT family N-acetyltransferase [Acidobacteriota bacterium]REK13521.1 MAG: GNAT family N-acetyltransferase [Acidobacteriota bacterium]REK41515.1 MAG: GNAT family N-acetyltransferase [Acidobacteriota bacterium]
MKKIGDFQAPYGLNTIALDSPVRGVTDSSYIAKLVDTQEEFEAVLRLRYEVFHKELGDLEKARPFSAQTDLDEFDLACEHLIVTERATGRAVGTYRLNTLETARRSKGFYASQEFLIDEIPDDVLEGAVELGRACIAKEHRNTRVLFLLWKVLANYMVARGKRYLFGCCSVFTQDPEIAAKVLQQIEMSGHLHDSIKVRPKDEKRIVPEGFDPSSMGPVELPPLVKIYLRVGCKVCGEPAIDREMKTIDYFVVFDLRTIDPKYDKMFFGESSS